MKDMSALGGGMGFYGELPDSYNLIVNSNHTLIKKIIKQKNKDLGTSLTEISTKLEPIKHEKSELENKTKDKKEDEILKSDKDKKEELSKKIDEVEKEKKDILEEFGKNNKIANQLIDLALLSNNLLKGEALNKFVKRSVDLIK